MLYKGLFNKLMKVRSPSKIAAGDEKWENTFDHPKLGILLLFVYCLFFRWDIPQCCLLRITVKYEPVFKVQNVAC
jgi:hypothetical protein